jgi:hypothetical protein
MTIKLAPWHLVLIGALVGVAVAGGIALAMSGGTDKNQTTFAQAPSGPDVAPTVVATLIPPPTPVPSPTPPPPPPPPPEPQSRTDCNAIRATGYQTDAERTYFLANCVSSGQAAGPAPARTATPAPRPVSSVGPTAEEARYRDQAAAQVYFAAARAVQYYQTPSYGFYSDLLELGSIVLNEANALHAIEPAPPRFLGTHNALIAALLSLHDYCLTVTNVHSLTDYNKWVVGFNARIDVVNGATDDYNRVVGVSLPTGGLR